MATAAPPPIQTQEHNNRDHLFRLLTLTIDEGTSIVRKIFDDKRPNVPLDVFLAQERNSIKKLRTKTKITKYQYDLLFPEIGTPATADFDFTLTMCLLRNLTPLGLNPNFSWTALAQPGDISLEADLRRLQISRNEMAHISASRGISQAIFEMKWCDIENVLLRLNASIQNYDPNLQQRIDECKNKSLDPGALKEKEQSIDYLQTLLITEVESLRMNRDCLKTLRVPELTDNEERDIASTWRRNVMPQSGNFIDTRDIPVRDYVYETSRLMESSEWVCMICFPKGSGTGFRVGAKYIMTAKHVVKEILDQQHPPVGQPLTEYAYLEDSEVYALFRYTKEGTKHESQKFRFKAVVHFADDNTDTAVLELQDDAAGTPMPLSFFDFRKPNPNSKFTFIGHSEGNRMEINHVDTVLDMSSEKSKNDLVQVQQESKKHVGINYDLPSPNDVTNPDRYLFHCKFTKGASGSPGVVILPNGHVHVVTMLLCGFPDWYYGNSVEDYKKSSWPRERCVEQGVNFESVYNQMIKTKPKLCNEIFKSYQ